MRYRHLVLLAAVLGFTGYASSQPGRTDKVADPSGPGDHEYITFGTTRERVFLWLGTPRTGWEIRCLHRGLYSFNDGTKVIFVGGKVISAIPGGLALGEPGSTYIIERNNRKIVIDAAVVCGSPIPPPPHLKGLKEEVETHFHFGPPTPVAPPPGPNGLSPIPYLVPPPVFSPPGSSADPVDSQQ